MWRAAAVIVLGGAALGVAYNAAGLASRPPRGIPWLAVAEELPTLESLAAPDSATGAAVDSSAVSGDAATAVPAGPVTRTEPAASAAVQPATPSHTGAGSKSPPRATASRADSSPNPGTRPPAAPDSGATAATPATPPPDTRQAAPIPFIPEMDRPIQIKLLTAKGLFDAKAALFLDARDPAEFEAGHVPGAIRLTRDEALGDPGRVKTLAAPTRPIVTYCEGGACESSLDLARVLVEAGYRRVLVYTGGFPEWAAAGHPVERGSGGP